MNPKDELEQLFDLILGQEIKELREALDISQTDAAAKFNNYRQWIGKLENGESSSSIYKVYAYLASNGIDILRVLQSTIQKFEAITNPIKMAADQAKMKDYVERTKARMNKENKDK